MEENPNQTAKVLENSFAFFVYPFLFNPSDRPDPFHQISAQIDTAQFEVERKDKKDPVHIWQSMTVSSDDLMPHVANFLGASEAEHLMTGTPTARFWKISGELRQELTLKYKRSWRLARGKRDIPFKFGDDFMVQLALFNIGVGFVTVNAKPVSDKPADWLDFLHDFRFMEHRNNVAVRVDQEIFNQGTGQKTMAEYLPLGVLASGKEGSFCFLDVIKILLNSVVPGGRQWWRDVYVPGHTLPHVGLYVNGLAEDEKSRLLHKLRNFFHDKQADAPSASDLCLDNPANLPYARDQWFLSTLNGGSFVAFDAPADDFNLKEMPSHLRKVYFHAYLLVLYQRFALAMLSEQVAEKGVNGTDEDQEKALECIRDALLDFTARGYFTQAMQSDHHHRYYRKWQEVFQISRLYEEVRNEVQDMYERATLRLRKQDDEREKREEEREKRMDNILTALGFLFVIPSLLLGFLGVNIRHITSGDEGLTLTTALLIFGLGFAGSCLAWFLLKKLTARNK